MTTTTTRSDLVRVTNVGVCAPGLTGNLRALQHFFSADEAPPETDATHLPEPVLGEPVLGEHVRRACVPPAPTRTRRKQRKMMSRSAELAAAAFDCALSGTAAEPPKRSGIVVAHGDEHTIRNDAAEHDEDAVFEDLAAFLCVGGSGGTTRDVDRMLAASMTNHQFDPARFGREGMQRANPLLAFQLMNNFTLCHAAIAHGVGGDNAAYFAAHQRNAAVVWDDALDALDRDVTSRAVVGGADSLVHPLSLIEARRRGDQGTLSEAAAVLTLCAPDARVSSPGGPDDGAVFARRIAGDAFSTLSAGGDGGADLLVFAGAPGPTFADWAGLSDDAKRTLIFAFDHSADIDTRASVGEWVRRGNFDHFRDINTMFGLTGAAALPLCWALAAAAVASTDDAPSPIRRAMVFDDVGALVFASTPQALQPAAHGGAAATMPRADRPTRARLRVDGRQREVVIVGVGAASALGIGAAALWDGLCDAASGVRALTHMDAATYPVRFGGAVPLDDENALRTALEKCGANIEALRLDERRAFLDRKVPFALHSANEAWRDAGLTDADAPHVDAALGLGLERALLEDFGPLTDDAVVRWRDTVRERASRLMYRTPVSVAAHVIGEHFGLNSLPRIHVSACAAGLYAVIDAAQRIRRGDSDIALCGASDSMLNPLGLAGMTRLGAPSPRNAADACRPFDAGRDGLAIGEGAAFFVLMDRATAVQRGLTPYATVLGGGRTMDGYAVTAPRPDGSGAARAMRIALDEGGVAPSLVDYVNAHGTGTPLNDIAEAHALTTVFGAQHVPPVSSTKGAHGHLMAAAGALELACTLLPFTRAQLPGTTGLGRVDPQIALPVLSSPQPVDPGRTLVAMTCSYGFGGQNGALVLSGTTRRRGGPS